MSDYNEYDFPGGHYDGRIDNDDDDDNYAAFILVTLIFVTTVVVFLSAIFIWAGRH